MTTINTTLDPGHTAFKGGVTITNLSKVPVKVTVEPLEELLPDSIMEFEDETSESSGQSNP